MKEVYNTSLINARAKKLYHRRQQNKKDKKIII